MSRRRHHSQAFSLFSFQDIITSVTGIIVLITLLLTVELLQRDTTIPERQSEALADQLREAIADANQETKESQNLLLQREQLVTESAALSLDQLEWENSNTSQQITRLQAEVQTLKSQLDTSGRHRDKWLARRAGQDKDRQDLMQIRDEIREIDEKLHKLKRSNRAIFNPSSTSGKTAWIVDVSSRSISVARVGIKTAPSVFSAKLGNGHVRAFLRWASQRTPASDYFLLLVRSTGGKTYDVLHAGLRKRGFALGFDLIGEGVTVIDSQDGAGY